MSTSWLCRSVLTVSVRTRVRARRPRQAARRPRAGSRRPDSRARKSSTCITLSFERVTTSSSADIDETSSRCSCRNQCMNCSATRSPSSPRSERELLDLPRHALLLVERELDRRDDVGERHLRRLDRGYHDLARRRRGGTAPSSSRGSAPRPPGGRSERRAAAASARRSGRRSRCTAATRRTRTRPAR